MTARQVISEMQTHLTCPWSSETVDTFKTGNPDDVVTGIAVSNVCRYGNPSKGSCQ